MKHKAVSFNLCFSIMERFAPLLNRLIPIIIVVGIVCTSFWSLNRGFGFADDGWYLYLLRDRPTGMATNFHLLFFSVFNDNIFLYRLLAFILELFSSLLLAVGAWKFQLKVSTGKSVHFWWFLAAALLGHCLGRISIDYVNLCVIISEITWGLLLLAFVNENKWYFILSGVFATLIIPLKITASPIILVYFLLIWVYTESKLKNCLLFISGCLITIAAYFTLIESPSYYFSAFSENYNHTVELGSRDYGITFLWSWLKGAYVYFFELLSVCFLFSRYVKPDKFKNHYVVFLVGLLFLLYLFFSGTVSFTGKRLDNPYILMWLLSFVLLTLSHNRGRLFLNIALIITPVFLSFGSDNMQRWENIYISSLFIGALFLADTELKQKVFYFTAVVITFFLLYGSFRNLSKATVDVSSIGINQNLKIDSHGAGVCAEMAEYVEAGDSCMCDMGSWGFVALLKQKPISSSFRIYTDEAKSAILRSIHNNTTVNIFLMASELDFGSKSELVEFSQTLPNVEVTHFGWEGYFTLIRHTSVSTDNQ